MIPRIFFAIVYLPRFPGYIGYQKSGINIAPFDQRDPFWDVKLVTWIFKYILLRQNMATGKASSGMRWIISGYGVISLVSNAYQPYPERTDLPKINKR